MKSRGYIKINENHAGQRIVQVKLVNNTVWLTKHEIARLFGIYINTVGNNFRAIFKNGILREEEVTRMEEYDHKGVRRFTTYYNLEAIIFLSYRVASFEAGAFREWIMNALCEYNRTDQTKSADVLVIYDMNNRTFDILPN